MNIEQQTPANYIWRCKSIVFPVRVSEWVSEMGMGAYVFGFVSSVHNIGWDERRIGNVLTMTGYIYLYIHVFKCPRLIDLKVVFRHFLSPFLQWESRQHQPTRRTTKTTLLFIYSVLLLLLVVGTATAELPFVVQNEPLHAKSWCCVTPFSVHFKDNKKRQMLIGEGTKFRVVE